VNKHQQPTSSFSTRLAALDAMINAPTWGHQRAFHVRRQIAYCPQRVGAVDVFEALPEDAPIVSYRHSRRIALHEEL